MNLGKKGQSIQNMEKGTREDGRCDHRRKQECDFSMPYRLGVVDRVFVSTQLMGRANLTLTFCLQTKHPQETQTQQSNGWLREVCKQWRPSYFSLDIYQSDVSAKILCLSLETQTVMSCESEDATGILNPYAEVCLRIKSVKRKTLLRSGKKK